MKIQPVSTSNPNLQDIAEGINRLHDCLEATRGDVETLKNATALNTSQVAVMLPVVSGISATVVASKNAGKWLVGAVISVWVGIASNYILHQITAHKQDTAAVAAQTAASRSATAVATAQDTDAKVTKVAKALGTEP